MLPKAPARLTRQNVFGDLRFFAVFRPQFRNPVGIGEKAHIPELININRRAVFKTKGKEYNS